jgi:hypothetical protein
MNHNVTTPIPMPLLACTAALVFALVASITLILVEEEEQERMEELMRDSLMVFREGRKQRGEATGDVARKKSYINWDRDRARQCIQEDYLRAVPRFNQDDFKRMFRVSRQNYEKIRSILCQSDCFFSDTYDARKRRSISIDAKIMILLKYMAYGTAINSFRDYFQMGESTSRLCLKHFVTGVLGSDEICNKYFRNMSSADAKRVEKMHHDAHGVRGTAFF